MFLKKRLSLFTLKELLILFIGGILTKILSSIKYNQAFIPLKKEIDDFIFRGYKIKRSNKLIYVDVKSKTNTSIAYCLLRPLSSDSDVFSQVIENEEYGPLITLSKTSLKADYPIVILDIGSNIGLASLYFKHHFKYSRILSVEADKSNFELQIKNVKINCFDSDIQVLHKALWINDDENLVITNDFRDGRSWSKSVSPNIMDLKSNFEITKSITLKSLIEKNIGKETLIDILKIDIEGAEAVLFRNSEFLEIIKKQVRFIGLEIHDEFNCRESINNELSKINFEIQVIGETTICLNRNQL